MLHKRLCRRTCSCHCAPDCRHSSKASDRRWLASRFCISTGRYRTSWTETAPQSIGFSKSPSRVEGTTLSMRTHIRNGRTARSSASVFTTTPIFGKPKLASRDRLLEPDQDLNQIAVIVGPRAQARFGFRQRRALEQLVAEYCAV